MRHPLDAVLVEQLEPAQVFAVGGRIRDEIREGLTGIAAPPKDLDYVVEGVDISSLVARLQVVGRVDVVGASFAVVKFRHDAGCADIALPRRERSTGSGHAQFEIEYGPDISLVDDLGRRDFRMNMIARRLSDDLLIDPYGGVADILARRIDVLGERVFLEDPLRMLRAAQFAARFGFTLSDDTRRLMTDGAHLVASISPERVGEELTKLLVLAHSPSIGLEILRETGVLAGIWPELLEGVGVDQNEWHAYDVYRHNLVTLDAAPPNDLILRLAALLHDVGKPRTKDGPHFYRHEHVGADLVPEMLERLRLPHSVIESVGHLVRHHMYVADPNLAPKAIRRFINRLQPESLERAFALRAADIAGSGLPKRDDANERFQARVFDILAESPPLSVRDLAIGGLDVIELLKRSGRVSGDFSGDRRVGEILRTLFERVLDDPALNEREPLLTAVEILVADAP